MPLSQLDDDSYEVIRHEPKLTRLDKARLRLDRVTEQHERLSAIANPSPEDRRKLMIVSGALEHAREQFARENKRATDDVYRRNEAVTEWRSENKDLYNAMRRKVRSEPNADLSGMTEAEKEQHRRDQKANSKWLISRRKKGWSEDQIEAAFAIYLQERAERRARQAALEAQALF